MKKIVCCLFLSLYAFLFLSCTAQPFTESTVKIICGGVYGSGFFINADGDILTCLHIVESNYDGEDIFVQTYCNDGLHRAKIVKTDKARDLALLKTDGKSKGLDIGGKDRVRSINGDRVTNFSSLRRVRTARGNETIEGFIVDLPLGEGNSGAPAVDASGKVSGIVQAKYNKGGIFCLSYAEIQIFLEDL